MRTITIRMGAATGDFAGTERFEVLNRLGRGGMGSVYQVVDRARKTRVALKTVGRVAGDSLLRFKREFRALQEIHHVNVVELGELFERDGEWFFTMELVSGTDFLQHVRPGSTPGSDDTVSSGGSFAVTELDPTAAPKGAWRRAARPAVLARPAFDEGRLRAALAALARALCALHQCGHVHRDVKPSNVLVDGNGRVVLIDFGLITDLADPERHSDDGHVMGTLDYMSPEQGAGMAVGPESDWYSMGVMLYEALTGRMPIEDSGLQALIRKQTEVPPSPSELVASVPADLEALCMDLLHTDPAKRPGDLEILRRLKADDTDGEVAPSPQPDLPSSERIEVFVGRDAELGELEAQLARVLGGEQAIVTLSGPSGLGKSALLRRFCKMVSVAHPEALVLLGRCYEQETVPYKALDAVMDQLSRWLKHLPNERVEKLLPDDVVLLERTFPVLQRVPAIAHARRDLAEVKDPQQRRIRVLRTLRALFRTLARRLPLVVVIDDFQWSDEDSQRMLDELTAPPDPPPLMLLFAARSDEKSRTWARGATVRLEPLTVDQSRDLALHLSRRSGVVDAARVDAVAQQAEGYPFFVEALLRQRDARPVAAVEELITRTVEALAPVARRLVEVVCTAGFPIAQEVAATAAGLDLARLSQQLRGLRLMKLTRTSGPQSTDEVEPYHDRIRVSVVGALPAPERQGIHGALAQALEIHGGEPERIAYHLRAGGDPKRAAGYLIIAADRAMEALAFDRAAEFYAEAQRIGELPADELRRLSVARGRALASAGRGQEAAAAFAQAIEGGTPSEVLDLRRNIAEQLLIAGWHQEGLQACHAFLDALGIRFPESPKRALFELATLDLYLRVRGLGHRVREIDRVPPDELARVDAYWTMAKGLAAHDPIRAQLFQVRGLIAALKAGEPHRISRSIAMHALSVAVPDPSLRPRADKVLATARELAARTGHPLGRALTTMVAGLLDYIGHCRWDKLDVGLAEHLLRTECEDVAWELNLCAISQKQSLYWLGQWRRLLDEVREHLQEAEERGDRYLGVQIRSHWMSFAAALEGDFARAHQEADYALGDAAPSPIEAFFILQSHVRVDLCEGAVDRALERVESYQPGLVGTLALRATIFRTLSEAQWLVVLLAAARRGDGARRRALYARAEKCANRLERPGVECTVPMAALGHAAIRAADGAVEESLRWQVDAERGFEAQSMLAHLAVSRRRRGQLIGGDEGRALIEEAEQRLAAEGVRDFVAVSRLLAPGFPAEE
jgi:serine/threonine protein kinase